MDSDTRERLKDAMIREFGTAMFNGIPAYVFVVGEVEAAYEREDDERLIEIAKENDFDLRPFGIY